MNTKKDQAYQARLKRMKEGIEKNKKDLEADFPDEVTYIGNPELIKKTEDEHHNDKDFDDD